MDRRWIVIGCVVVLLIVTLFGAAGCRAIEPEHWSFTCSSWAVRMLGQSKGGDTDVVFGVLMVFGFLVDVVAFPFTGVRDLVWIATRPPANTERSTAPGRE